MLLRAVARGLAVGAIFRIGEQGAATGGALLPPGMSGLHGKRLGPP